AGWFTIEDDRLGELGSAPRLLPDPSTNSLCTKLPRNAGGNTEIAMPQYYTLEEAAKLLATTPDELKLMAKKGELRPFQDRGTLRFRSQEIDEMARRRGRGSEPDLQLG